MGILTQTFVGLVALLKAMHVVPPMATYPDGMVAVHDAHAAG